MLHVTFLAHSGFLVEDGKRCYVFDYYKDPNNIVWQLAKRGRELWFFVSHTHGDHFNPSITEFDESQDVLLAAPQETTRTFQTMAQIAHFSIILYNAPW